jgi:DNA-binding NarL/FixJ family response regulator
MTLYVDKNSPLRVLVAEDFEPFRLLIHSMLESSLNLQIICEVSDGVKAVRKTEELQPHLIVLDVGLPSLNGIAAARQIRRLSPQSKIVFLSLESSPDVVHEAICVGNAVYVTKTAVGTDLLPAIEAVLQNRQFVSNALSFRDLTTLAPIR